MKTCFILGIGQRSGTNFLYEAIKCHAQCCFNDKIPEDYLVSGAHYLINFGNTLSIKWKRWEIEKNVVSTDEILQAIGETTLSKLQGKDFLPSPQKSVFLLKTPSVENLQHFNTIFPNSKLIILVRDGRNMVESGIRSFGWDFEEATLSWAKSATSISEYISLAKSNSHLLIRYEDLYTDPIPTIKRVCDYLGLDFTEYDIEKFRGLGVYGSSDLAFSKAEIDWKPRDRTAKFTPNSRHKSWSLWKKSRFHWLAGAQLEQFGYKPDRTARRFYTLHILFTFRRRLRSFLNSRLHRIRSRLRALMHF